MPFTPPLPANYVPNIGEGELCHLIPPGCLLNIIIFQNTVTMDVKRTTSRQIVSDHIINLYFFVANGLDYFKVKTVRTLAN